MNTDKFKETVQNEIDELDAGLVLDYVSQYDGEKFISYDKVAFSKDGKNITWFKYSSQDTEHETICSARSRIRHDRFEYVELNDSLLYLSEDRAKQLVSFYEDIIQKENRTFARNYKNAQAMVNDLYPNMKPVLNRFLNKIPIQQLLNKRIYQIFIYLCTWRDDAYNELYNNIDESLKNEIISVIKRNKNLYNQFEQYADSFMKLCDLLSSDYNIPDEYSIAVTWLLLRKSISDHYSYKWEQEYGNQLTADISISTMDDYVIDFCNNSTFAHKDENTRGLLTHYFITKGKFQPDCDYAKCLDILNAIIDKTLNSIEKRQFRAFILSSGENVHFGDNASINDVDLMNGIDFEGFIANIFRKMGFEIEFTKSTGDQGIDILARKGNDIIGIQTKCYSHSVGNSAIQEAVAGSNYYSCNKAIVITNNYFTKSAFELAQSNNVILWDRDMLKRKLEELVTI